MSCVVVIKSPPPLLLSVVNNTLCCLPKSDNSCYDSGMTVCEPALLTHVYMLLVSNPCTRNHHWYSYITVYKSHLVRYMAAKLCVTGAVLRQYNRAGEDRCESEVGAFYESAFCDDTQHNSLPICSRIVFIILTFKQRPLVLRCFRNRRS